MVPLSYRLSLYIREFFGDLPITNTEDIDTTYMSTRPRVTPKLHDAVIERGKPPRLRTWRCRHQRSVARHAELHLGQRA